MRRSGRRMAFRPLATRGIHALVAKDNPKLEELLRTINLGLATLKQRDDYVDVIGRHVFGLLVRQGGG
jgi:hypothetical protein